MIQIGINGAAGRVGQRLITLASQAPDLQVVAALEHAGHEHLGTDVGQLVGRSDLNVILSESVDPKHQPQIIIDFTTPRGCREVLQLCRRHKIALVTGTTGLSAEDEADIDAAANDIPVLQAPNMSLGVNLLFALVAQVARRLGPDYDIEIVEAHHRHKIDAPSGTAWGLAQAICQATGADINRDIRHGRSGEQPRREGEIGMHAMRLGDEVGRHEVSFATDGEQISLTHRASTRDVFARGALHAARWLAGQQPGRYTMKDVLEL